MACCSWISSTFCFIASCVIIVNISCAVAEPTVIPSGTTTTGTSNDTATEEYIDYHKTTSAKRSGVVTIEFEFDPLNEAGNETRVNVSISDEVTRVHRLTKDVVVKILNSAQNVTLPARATTPAGQEESGRRRRRAAATSHDVELVAVDPPVKDGRLRTPIVASDQGGKVVSAAQLENDLHDNKQQISDETGYPVADVYVGLPPDVRPLESVDDRPTIWDKHLWMFLIVAILLLIAFVTGLLCCIFYYCCRKVPSDRKQPPPLLKKAPVEKPPVEEKMEMTRAAPVQQSAPPPPSSPMKEQPTMTAAPPPHTDDENGWIIPLDQLSQDELDQPEVQISRL